MAEGFTNQEIARKLFISVKTVQAHRANLMKKLGVHDRVKLVKYALKKGLVHLEKYSPYLGCGDRFCPVSRSLHESQFHVG